MRRPFWSRCIPKAIQGAGDRAPEYCHLSQSQVLLMAGISIFPVSESEKSPRHPTGAFLMINKRCDPDQDRFFTGFVLLLLRLSDFFAGFLPELLLPAGLLRGLRSSLTRLIFNC